MAPKVKATRGLNAVHGTDLALPDGAHGDTAFSL